MNDPELLITEPRERAPALEVRGCIRRDAAYAEAS
jgi:hypothetical protein